VEVKGMADRIISMREALYDLLQNKYKTPGDWSHVKKQIGMFSYTGLKPEQVDALATHASIYLTRDGKLLHILPFPFGMTKAQSFVSMATGRISMAALNSSNLEVSLTTVFATYERVLITFPPAVVLCRKRLQGGQGRTRYRKARDQG
jgi:hypothetical protein